MQLDGKFRLGLNETQLGIDINLYLQMVYKGCIGQRNAEWAIQVRSLLSNTLLQPFL